LAQGDLKAANRWSTTDQKEHSGPEDRFGFENELTLITRARVLIALNIPDDAIGLLSDLEDTARSAERLGRVIEILLLKALALQEKGDSERAILALTECLTLAESGGYVRIFLDEGRLMQLLLSHWLTHVSVSPLRDYAIHLLSQFDAESQVIKAVGKKVAPIGNLIDPLSPRELEVLHLMALGKTNQEIANTLIVARGTIKAQAVSIFRKLDAANRTEAVARARQLGILP
jgi:LuxR family maltose regulon positive regulatory protein